MISKFLIEQSKLVALWLKRTFTIELYQNSIYCTVEDLKLLQIDRLYIKNILSFGIITFALQRENSQSDNHLIKPAIPNKIKKRNQCKKIYKLL